jgi:sugar/nucleoside kinase (ribokinase family)
MKSPVTISGAGCCLVDQIYPDIDFTSPNVARYLSRSQGDGGLYPGRLVFSEQFESFAGSGLLQAINEISRDRKQPAFNVGGPSIVALIHAAQLLQDSHVEVRFYGARGNDPAGEYLQEKLEQTPVILDHFRIAEGPTPSTMVLSDPSYNRGHGERMFVNSLGTAWKVGPEDLDEDFFHSDLVVFGGTALVPGLHDQLTELLKHAKSKDCRTVVNTVYDFRSELQHPGRRWPLGKNDESYRHVDLLIMDKEEALHLSGTSDLAQAGSFFMHQGVASYIITNGTEETHCYSNGNFFKANTRSTYPVSDGLISKTRNFSGGDTTGCGDNFVGGVLASLAWQLQNGDVDQPDLEECIAWGTVSGGYCCFHVGGTFIEMEPGEKLELIRPYFELYNKQIHG